MIPIYVILGSTSDEHLFLPGAQQKKAEDPELTIRVNFASADNTEEKVKGLVRTIMVHSRPTAIVSGAGKTNILSGMIKNMIGKADLSIAIPFSDEETGGLNALLSSSEKPLRNAVLCTGINASYCAINLARKFMYTPPEGAIKVVAKGDYPQIKAVTDIMDNLKIGYMVKKPEQIQQDDLVLNLCCRYTNLKPIDSIVSSGRGIQVAVREQESINGWQEYMDCFSGLKSTGFVGIGEYMNAVQVAAKISRNLDCIQKIELEKKSHATKIRGHKGYDI
ncbi:MAG: AIR carboxylase family protein [Candidatus Woesearchaeota archaeon]